jgi:hypothetical protein
LSCEDILGGILTKGIVFAISNFLEFIKELSSICIRFAGDKVTFNSELNKWFSQRSLV